MKVHRVAQVSSLLDRVDEVAREPVPEVSVVAAATPLPVAVARRAPARATSARARVDAALAARTRYSVHESSARQRVDERRLPATWKQEDLM